MKPQWKAESWRWLAAISLLAALFTNAARMIIAGGNGDPWFAMTAALVGIGAAILAGGIKE